MTEIYLSLGTNVGDTRKHMKDVLERLAQLPQTKPLEVSRAYLTSPVGYADQPDFLNLCCSLKTELQAETFHRLTKRIESDFGRVKTVLNGPRIIDVDLLFLSNGETRTETPLLPHPRLFERAFVLAPLMEIYPHEKLFGLSLKQCLQKALDSQRIRRLETPLFGDAINQFVNSRLRNA